MPIQFTSSDVWLLLAIALAEGEPPVHLPDILFAGDAINKAVFSPQELRRGFSKLTQAGYVRDSTGDYSLSKTGRMLISDARKHDPRWLSMWKYIEKRLAPTAGANDAPPAGANDAPQFDDPRYPYPQLTDEMVEVADAQYRAKFAELLAELEAKHP